MDSINNLTWFTAFGLIAVCWRQCLAFFQRVRSFIIVRTSVQGDVARAVSQYCWRNYRRSPFGDRFYRSGGAYIRSVARMQEVAWEMPPSQPLIFFDGWKPFLIGGNQHNNDLVPQDGLVTIVAVRWWLDTEALIVQALDTFNANKATANKGHRRYGVYRINGQGKYRNVPATHGGVAVPPSASPSALNPTPSDLHQERVLKWEAADIGLPVPENPLASLSLPPDIQPALEEFQRWLAAEDWFRARKVPWRRGWLLGGPPGTGKTSMVRTMAQMSDIPIFAYDLSTLSNDEMVSQWQSMLESVPCLALMEDIDGVFDGRTNIHGEQGGGLTFDCLLNCISGVQTADGVFLIITTNHPEKVDPALGVVTEGMSSRPGRIDRVITMPPLPATCRTEIAQRILGEWPAIIPDLVAKSDGYTGAQFTELCVAEALQRFWKA